MVRFKCEAENVLPMGSLHVALATALASSLHACVVDGFCQASRIASRIVFARVFVFVGMSQVREHFTGASHCHDRFFI